MFCLLTKSCRLRLEHKIRFYSLKARELFASIGETFATCIIFPLYFLMLIIIISQNKDNQNGIYLG